VPRVLRPRTRGHAAGRSELSPLGPPHSAEPPPAECIRHLPGAGLSHHLPFAPAPT